MKKNKQNNVSQAKPVIAVFGSDLHSEIGYKFVSALEKGCDKLGYYVLAFSFADEYNLNDQELAVNNTLINLIHDIYIKGIIIMRESLTSDMLASEIMKIANEREIPVYSLEKPTAGCVSITFDYAESFKKIVRHVVEVHGCKDIAMMAGLKNNEFSDERVRACREALAEYGLELKENRLFYGAFWDRPTREVMHKLVETKDIPQAICCANDAMAVTVIDVLKEHGYHVPQDVVVTGFDGIDSGHFNNPPISSMAPDYATEVEMILDMICNKSSKDKIQIQTKPLHYILSTDRSCGCEGTKDEVLKDTLSELSNRFKDMNWVQGSMNRVVAEATRVDSVDSLADYIDKQIGLWIHNLYHVAVFAELTGLNPVQPEGNTYKTLYRNEGGNRVELSGTYSEQVFLPGLNKFMEDENLSNLLLVRMLYTGTMPYGYTVEGFKNHNHRDFLRGNEFAMFISTAMSVALANINLMRMNRRLQETNTKIETISVTDYLTGIYNRRGFFTKIYDVISDSANFGKYLSIYSIDMDGLKSINDVYGHEDGDFAIKMVAEAIKSFSARNGFCARYGGDEFACVILTNQLFELPVDEVRRRLRSVICSSHEALNKPYPITVSIGNCGHVIDKDFNKMKERIDEMVRVADEKMYHDKEDKQRHIDEAKGLI